MNNPAQLTDWQNKIFAASFYNFNRMALELFQFQYENNELYRQYTNSICNNIDEIDSITKIPFLPIQFFKTHTIKTTEFNTDIIFESSGTTQTISSKHHIKDIGLYKKNFLQIFELFYGEPNKWCIIGLLPSYLERNNSSLVFMVDELIKQTQHSLSGFYLHDHKKLHQTLLHNEILHQPTLLIGVTFALLEFAEKYKMRLHHTIIMETGGMKGRRQEITRQEVHEKLMEQLGITHVHSEYGMTELLSQAYSRSNGLFKCPPWMKVLIRDEDDPLLVKSSVAKNTPPQTGLINIIDLANIYSCAFIATDDAGKLHSNDNFEVLGRCDNSEMRGCSLLTFN